MKSGLLASLLAFSLWGCKPAQQTETAVDKAQWVIDRAIDAHGGSAYEELDVQFLFRGQCFSVHRRNGYFTYYRHAVTATGDTLSDTLSNEGFRHYSTAMLSDSLLQKSRNAAYSTTNSVVYFALLPFGLNDPAVIKEYAGETVVKGKSYHKVRVTFLQDGGGDDHEDEFMYWFDRDDFSMDFLAYAYHTNGGGVRFRVATAQEHVADVVWQQYDNYEAPKEAPAVLLDSLFEAGALKKLSEIRLDDVSPAGQTGNSCL